MAFKRIWHQAEVLAALDAGAVLVTSGERLARAARLAHGEARLDAGAGAWVRPEALSYGAFVERLYDAAADAALSEPGKPLPKRIATAAAESYWEGAIRASAEGAALLQPTAAAREAARAWELLNAYRVPLGRIAAGDEDARAFAAWAEHFTAASRAQAWLEDARLVDWLATQLRNRALPVPARILFAGFDGLTPQQQELIESLCAGGSRVDVLEMTADSVSEARRWTADDAEGEMRAAAAWARALLEQDPAASIGIVARDLADCRAALARALDDALCPAAAAGRAVARPYDLSLGLPLASFPVVHAAFATLELLARRAPFTTASLLLRSPFLAGAEAEQPARARLELRLRERVSEHIGLKTLTSFATTLGGVPQLLRLLQSLQEKSAALPAKQLPSAWARDLADALTRAGWPGERRLDSGEYQTVNALRDLIGQLVHLDSALGPVPFNDALSRLKRLANEHIFQPAGADAPVQVLGLLETAGLAFDHLWLMGLTDDAWPAGPRPVSFIPPRLQREFGLPHAGAAIELDFARRVTGRLLASAPRPVVSTAAAEGDTPLRPSPLIAELPLLEQVPQATESYRALLQRESAQATERYRDMRAPALRPGEQTRGGTGLIKSQAICPFQSFAINRLGAKPLEEPAFGPDALERGNLMHEVLHAVWEELKDHAHLAALDASARRALAERAAARAVSARSRELPDVYTPRVTALEKERLAGRVSAWLDKEALRPPFRVLESEAEHLLKIGRLSLRTRVDRIDELPDGGRVIIDYKTGQVDVNAWLEPRPDEPQLPLYAIANPERLAGLMFACLKPGEMRFAGLAERDGVAAGVTAYAGRKRRPEEAPDWGALMRYWQANLESLAVEYAEGDARVQPKSAADCERCHLSTFCRIHELGDPSDDA